MSDFKLTYSTMFAPPRELHERFDAALARVRQGLGQTHGLAAARGENFGGVCDHGADPFLIDTKSYLSF